MIVVEHDEAVIRAADWAVDLGPGAGPDGGQIVATCRPEQLADVAESVTGRYLHQRRPQPPRPKNRLETVSGWIVIHNASEHNLKAIEARIPLGTLTCVSGVSGSGKSTLVHDVLAREYRHHALGTRRTVAGTATIEGLDAIESLVEVDQSPIGRSPRSTPATFTGVFDAIRKVFAATRQAKMPRLRSRAVQLQRPGRAMRGVRGAGPAQGSHAVPARSLCDLRGVPGPAVQPPDPGNPLQRQVDRRGPGDAR